MINEVSTLHLERLVGVERLHDGGATPRAVTERNSVLSDGVGVGTVRSLDVGCEGVNLWSFITISYHFHFWDLFNLT